MAGFAEGVPCWTDATVPDVTAGKRFYGELFGWSFAEGQEEYGGYAQAFSDGKAVGALAPQMAGQDVPPAWTLYFATPNVRAAADRVRGHGGQVLTEPMEVGDLGSMALAADPAGALFGVWQAGRHRGFEKQGEAGAYCWAEIVTRDPEAADAFYPDVFPYEVRQAAGSHGAYKVWKVDGEPVSGRLRMPEGAPARTPSHAEVYFGVEDCDAAAERVDRLGGRVLAEPADSPYGRYAPVVDPQGVAFTVIDPGRTSGQVPELV
ncbi:VOC family protein [Streptomyces sp. DSM 44917]|uniref:VOC family protein n=1 Tax=Streptomyces boetiae TaxID=3075541 RepID=A0ABU2L881_9ACTN|nr:VOC family protein [Streptomyces sp. DSM 44917]MDT0307418.1 VOC family protein [Streptomyces sp. DSM 44917]